MPCPNGPVRKGDGFRGEDDLEDGVGWMESRICGFGTGERMEAALIPSGDALRVR